MPLLNNYRHSIFLGKIKSERTEISSPFLRLTSVLNLFPNSSHSQPIILFTFRDEAKVIKNDFLHTFSIIKTSVFTFDASASNACIKMSNYMNVTLHLSF